MADRLTPVMAFELLAGEGGKAFLLESVEKGESMGRYSFIGADPDDSFEGGFEELKEWLPPPGERLPGLPPFTGGAVGFFSFDLARELETLPDRGKAKEEYQPAQPIVMERFPTVVAFDHVKQQILIISRAGRESIDVVERKLSSPSTASVPLGFPDSGAGDYRPNMSESEFVDAVLRSKEYIAAGDIFQVVLSQRFDMDFDGDPFLVYRALRHINPSPYMFFFRRGGMSVAGSSPEMLVRITDREVSYRRDRGHAATRAHACRGRPARTGTARRREGARGAPDAGGPRPQRSRPHMCVRDGAGRAVHVR